MGQVISMPGDPHQQAQALLPWYINGTLDEDEAVAVEAHLAVCAECRHDLAAEQMLHDGEADITLDVEHGWAAMRDSIEQQAAAVGSAAQEARVVPLRKSLWRRSIPIGWALAAQAAAIVLVAGGTRLMLPTSTPKPLYHALGSAPQRAPGNVVVIFRPDTIEQELRGAVVKSGAELVGGPTASNAYVLRVASHDRVAALTRLRSNRYVVLAEPIDGSTQQ